MMTLGEKLVMLRRKSGYTQEYVAELLGVSRQSVSKWESDLAYPETDKLIRIGDLYGCSMDFLLRQEAVMEEDDVAPEERQADGAGRPSDEPRGDDRVLTLSLASFSFERKSKRSVCGVPLWHVNVGSGRCARGIIAVGLVARGVVSIGIFSLGILSIGLFALGLLAFGAMTLGLLSVGAISVGVLAFGAVCVGILSIGALSIGECAIGALAIGNYFALGDTSYASVAIGTTEAVGTLYEAARVTEENREEILRILQEMMPAVLSWLRRLMELFV